MPSAFAAIGLLSSPFARGNVRTLYSLRGTAKSAGMTPVRVEAGRNTSAAVWRDGPQPSVFGPSSGMHLTSLRET